MTLRALVLCSKTRKAPEVSDIKLIFFRFSCVGLKKAAPGGRPYLNSSSFLKTPYRQTGEIPLIAEKTQVQTRLESHKNVL